MVMTSQITKTEELYEKSKAKWGLNSQLLMMAEEASELSVASLHMTRTVKNDTDNKRVKTLRAFAKELVDTQFMIDEMIYYFKDVNVAFLGADYTFFDLMLDVRQYKENRLKKLLEGSK